MPVVMQARQQRVRAAAVLRDVARVVVVAPHPDDDVLGCGGLLAAAAASGCDVRAIYVTDGGASHVGSPSFPPARLSAVREDEACAALAELGVTAAPQFFRIPDGTLATMSADIAEKLTQRIADVIVGRGERSPVPTLVLGPWRRDPHPDHRAAAQLVHAACALAPHAALLEYRVWLDERGERADHPSAEDGRAVAIEIGAYVGRKQAALAQHRSQLGQLIHDAEIDFVLPAGLIARAGEDWEYFTRAD
jgi:LmbE family N-acetylglucosaminyl deacetylase